MSSPGRPPAGEGMYCHLLDEDVSFTIQPTVRDGPGFRPVRSLLAAQPYRLATVCLLVLSAALLVAVIIVATQHRFLLAVRDRNQPKGGAEESSSSALQTQGQNTSTLVASIKKLQQENQQLQQEKQQLQQEKQQLQQEKQQLQQKEQQLQQEKQQLQQEKQQLQQEKQQLQQEKQQLQQEKADLLSRLGTTKAPEVLGRTSGTPAAPLLCNDGSKSFRNSCYTVSRMTLSWSSSEEFCRSKGGHLAIITTAEEQTFVWNLLPRGHWNAFWIGITDRQIEDKWTWVDGTPLVRGFWEVGEPNNHVDEDCGYIVKTRVLSRVAIRSWYDAPCSMSCRFICELELGGAPNSTATTSPQ